MGQNARDNSATYSSQGISQRADNQSHSKIINHKLWNVPPLKS